MTAACSRSLRRTGGMTLVVTRAGDPDLLQVGAGFRPARGLRGAVTLTGDGTESAGPTSEYCAFVLG